MRVASSEKIKKHVGKERIMNTLSLMENSCIKVPVVGAAISSCLRDVNDLYFLSLADTVQADYILTGDKDLLTLQSYNQTKIVTYNEFAKLHE